MGPTGPRCTAGAVALGGLGVWRMPAQGHPRVSDGPWGVLPVIGQDQRPPPVRPSACCLGFEGFPGLWLCSMPSGTPLFVPGRSWPPSARSALSYHTPLQRLTTIFPSIIPSIIHTVHHPEEPQLGRNGRRCFLPHPHALYCGMWAPSFHYSSTLRSGQSHF